MENRGMPPPPAYAGDGKYVFISYSHKDEDRVHELIRALQERGVHIWYDSGIYAGTLYNDVISEHIKNCALLISFNTQALFASEYCKNELLYAQRLKKNIINVIVSNEMPGWYEMMFAASYQQVPLNKYGSLDKLADSLILEPMVIPCIERNGAAPVPADIGKSGVGAAERTAAEEKTEKKPRAVTEQADRKAAGAADGKAGRMRVIVIAAAVTLCIALTLAAVLIINHRGKEESDQPSSRLRDSGYAPVSSAAPGLSGIRTGDVIRFGTYEQDNDSSDGKEKIEWIVLNVSDGSALVVSRYALDCRRYNPDADELSWEKSQLRTWLNETFANAAFDPQEQEKLCAVPSSEEGRTAGDRVFLLNVAEAEKYFSSDETRKCAPTQYAIARGVWTNSAVKTSDNAAACQWWLCTPGTNPSCIAHTDSYGAVMAEGVRADLAVEGVRPAVLISLKP